MSKNQFHILKSSGRFAAFEEEKLRKSLEFSGASKAVIGSIIKRIKSLLYPSISTAEIYDLAYDMLMEHSTFYGARYKLKKAIFELGPSGFPFEKYINELLLKEGFNTELNQVMEGKCISHEMDVVAQKNDELYLVECKFHSDRTRVGNVKVPLYIQSRFLDLKSGFSKDIFSQYNTIQAWIITNTRFTKDAIDFARCSDLRLMAWNYPLDFSLKMLVDKHQLYPITSLSSISQAEKKQILHFDVVLCSQLKDNQGLLEKIGISSSRIKTILEECNYVCYLQKNGTKRD